MKNKVVIEATTNFDDYKYNLLGALNPNPNVLCLEKHGIG
jgi:hypothetical protein